MFLFCTAYFCEMPSSNIHLDSFKNNLIHLIKKIKDIQPDLGAYIEHFHYNENVIIVKLTNGFLKVNELILSDYQRGIEDITEEELVQIGQTFEKYLL